MPVTYKILYDFSILKNTIGNGHCLWSITRNLLVTGIVARYECRVTYLRFSRNAWLICCPITLTILCYLLSF
jgi:hypothetical protein